MFFTVPVSTMPSDNTSSVCFFFSSRSSSRTERRERTTLPRRRLSLMTFARIVWPTMEARFFTGRRSTWEPGRNALTPTSTARPPLTTSTTRPSTGASLEPTWTTRPRTTSPSSNSVTPVPYQSSMRSSAASPPSRGPPRVCRGSFIMPPSPPVILFASTCVRLGLGPAGAARDAVPQPRDRLHHLAAGNLVSLLAISATLRPEPQRLTERDGHLRRAREPPASRPRAARAPHVHRDHRRAAQHRQHPGTGLGRAEDALVAAGALREDQQRPSVGEHPPRGAQRPGVCPLAPDWSRVQAPDQSAESWDLEQLCLRQEAHLPDGRAPDQRWIEQAGVVRNQQHRSRRRDILTSARLQAEQRAHDPDREQPQDRVQPIRGLRRAGPGPVVAAVSLDRRGHPFDDLLGAEVGRVDLDRAGGLPEGRQLTGLVLPVSSPQLVRDRVQRSRRSDRAQLGLPTAGARFERGGQVELHLGVRAHDRPGVPPLEDHAPFGGQLALQRRDLRAHRPERRDLRGDPGDLLALDGFRDVLAVQIDVPGLHR